jgi:predicted amidohydrolase
MKIAIVQPITYRPPDDAKNVPDALRYIEEAAAGGAELVTFPESYPGPWRMPATFNPSPAISEAAKLHGIYVQYGTLEPVDDVARTAYAVLMLADPAGELSAYRRTHPPGPWIYTGGAYWDFMYQPGDEYPVFETKHGEIGMAMCSEVYMPEVSRALCLRGAEVLLMPAGVDKRKLWTTWRHLIWARAIENLAIVVTTQNLFSESERGLAMVATPEEVVFESTRPGIYLVDVDVEALRKLRADVDVVGSWERLGVKAGVLSQWQRPEMYPKLHERHR